MRGRMALMACLAIAGCDPGDETSNGGSAGGKGDDVDGVEDVEVIAVTAQSVEDLGGDFTSVTPVVGKFAIGDGLDPADYFKPMGALGHYGPLGEFGPLGVLGPVGDATWNPSTWFEIAGPWEAFAQQLTAVDGPLSSEGPLGSKGPLNREQRRKTLEAIDGLGDSFIDQLEPGGLFVPLGVTGPLGALGPLGPLGPVGAHGYEADDSGQYVPEEGECAHSDEVDVCRHATVRWDGDEERTYELFENYDAEFAQTMESGDTSFMTSGELAVGESATFQFTSAQTQVVTALVVGQWTLYDPATSLGLLSQSALIAYDTPSFVLNYVAPFFFYDHASSFDDFDLELMIDTGDESLSVASASVDMVDWISVTVPAGAKIEAKVSLASRWSAPWRVFGPEYRLFVVGSTPRLATFAVAGDHHVRLAE